jgi:predicted nucleic acid-binding protein
MARVESLWVDSDILLDYLGNRQPWVSAASQLLDLATTSEVKLWVSPLILANVFYLLRKQIGTEQALESIAILASLLEIAGMGRNEVHAALASARSDFEDALQTATAEAVPGLSALITRNVRDYALSRIPAMTAEAWLAIHRSP